MSRPFCTAVTVPTRLENTLLVCMADQYFQEAARHAQFVIEEERNGKYYVEYGLCNPQYPEFTSVSAQKKKFISNI